jgi:possible type I restriction-modification system, S subunit
MKRYDAYKSTGIPWIPEVPEHWEMRKLRHFIEIISEKNHPQEPLLSIVRDQGVILRDITSKEENHNAIPDDLSGYKLIEKGHFAINKMKAWQGSYGVSSYRGIVSPAYYTCRLNFEHKAYFNLAIRSDAYVPFFTQYSKGIRVGQWDLSPIGLKEIPFFLPPLSEQRAIVAYIERKERQIDTYIARQAEQIERLKELRQTIISHAVTRGIHPYTRFRPTGIPWIPEVPEHWECVELKRVTVFNPSRKENIDGDTLVGYAPMEIVRSNMESCLTIKVCKLTAGLTYFEEGDVVLAKVTPCFENGNVAIIPRMIHYCGFGSSELFVYRCKDKLAPKLLFYYFQSAGFVSAGTASMTGTGGLKRVSPVFARNAKIPLPPLSEQRAIVAYIEKKTAAVDRMINACREQTELMKAYKQRLISDAVTGRINGLPHD